MRLDLELVKRGLCESRTEAQGLISSEKVLVNNVIVTKVIKQVSEQDSIIVTSRRKFVSRGGEKLEGILTQVIGDNDAVSQFCANKQVLDVGSSTGGFTDCLLQKNVQRVDAVDVGTGQLHDKIKNDKRVSSFENTDIRNFIPLPTSSYDIIVADLSFVSLETILDTVVSFGKSGTSFFLLIKPQFEVGKGNTKKGIVKNAQLVDEILLKYQNLSEKLGLTSVVINPCVIQGGDGNQEYFLYGILQ